MSFQSLGLAPELLRAVADEGYETPTPVQAQAIPLVLAGRDLLAGAQTGTGKTAAFVLPILQMLAARRAPLADAPARPVRPGAPRPAVHPVRVLVLAPTRELALQVETAVRTYGRHRQARSVAIYGGVGMEPQVRALRAGPSIVVATPGRLLDHVGRGTIDLSRVEILVLDEADRMLDMGFIRDIRKVLDLLPAERQNLLFSATFSQEIRTLAQGILHDPASVDVAPRNTAAELVEQLVIPVDRHRKQELLVELVRSGRVSQALLFVRTKHGANRLADQLARDGVPAAAIHGNKSQSQRIRALEDFKAGRVGILVATDIAARGIDIDGLPHVVNVELPMVAADYVHRIGRTGRAGSPGHAISLVCVDEAGLLREIEKLLGRAIPAEVLGGFEPDRAARPEPIRLRSGEVRGRAGGMPQRAPRQAVAGQHRPDRGVAPANPPRRPGRAGSQPGRSVGQPGRGQQPFRGGQPQPQHRAGQPNRAGQQQYRGPQQNRGGRPPQQFAPRYPMALPGERLSRIGAPSTTQVGERPGGED